MIRTITDEGLSAGLTTIMKSTETRKLGEDCLESTVLKERLTAFWSKLAEVCDKPKKPQNRKSGENPVSVLFFPDFFSIFIPGPTSGPIWFLFRAEGPKPICKAVWIATLLPSSIQRLSLRVVEKLLPPPFSD